MAARQTRTLNRLEHKLEHFFERLFGAKLNAENILRAVHHAFEDALNVDLGGGVPIQITIRLHPMDYSAIQADYPFLDRQIAAHLVEAGREGDTPLPQAPQVTITWHNEQGRGTVGVFVQPIPQPIPQTDKMEAVAIQPANPPTDAQFWRDGYPAIYLTRGIINIGRSLDNHLVLDGTQISRHHCQLRVRGGQYVLYDLNSTHGVFVNNVRVREHVLVNGDVLRLGAVQLVYLQDESTDQLRSGAGDTQNLPPLV